MKIINRCFVFVLLCIMLVSCRKQELFQFLNPIEEITNISIVEINFGDENEIIQTEIVGIDDISAFINDFQKVNCYVYYGDPLGVTPEGVDDIVVKIMYENGEYELINWSGQSEYTIQGGFSYYKGFNVFEEKQFEFLISKYQTTDENQNT